jgi:trehalose 6-phosphate synthase/phosphatase
MTHPVSPLQPRLPVPDAATSSRVLIAANRLPLTLQSNRERIEVRPSSGGLATGLTRIQHHYRSRWIGWTGMSDDPGASIRHDVDSRLRSIGMIAIHLSRPEVTGFYHRYANAVLWPILHDLAGTEHGSDDWETYRNVNARFADAIVRELRSGDLVWIHDYHLMLVPRLVREQCPWARIGFFLHTPFPTVHSFARIPHAATLLDGLLGADAIGVHTDEYVQNLLETVCVLEGRATLSNVVTDQGRAVRVFACPMSVDSTTLGSLSADPTLAAEAVRIRGSGPLFVGVDRLDYTKGIPERLRAFERLLESDTALHGRARLVQVAVPSREEVSGYGKVRREVEATVARINHRWATPDWQPIDYRYRSIPLKMLVTLYRAADVMLVTPVRDGLNLVAKEFVAARVDDDGVLVLSERAGAAAELRTALLVDPTDERALTNAYVAALTMLPAERRVRMRHLRLTVASHDVYRWAERVLDTIACDDGSRIRATHG